MSTVNLSHSQGLVPTLHAVKNPSVTQLAFCLYAVPLHTQILPVMDHVVL